MTKVTCSYGDYNHLGYKGHTNRPRDNSMAPWPLLNLIIFGQDAH